MSKIVTLILFLMVLLLFFYPGFPAYAQQQPQQSHEKIVEEVDVTNVEVAVRVFLKGEPIPGLKKEDFNIFKQIMPKSFLKIIVFFEKILVR